MEILIHANKHKYKYTRRFMHDQFQSIRFLYVL